jgi:hypothetical protein
MATPPSTRQPNSDGEAISGAYHVTRKWATVGSGGFVGVGLSGAAAPSMQTPFADEPTVTLHCRLCGWANDSVPTSKRVAFQLEHEEHWHPAMFQQRKVLLRKLREFDQQLWENS